MFYFCHKKINCIAHVFPCPHSQRTQGGILKGCLHLLNSSCNAHWWGPVHFIQSILETSDNPLKRPYGSPYYMTVSHWIKSAVTHINNGSRLFKGLHGWRALHWIPTGAVSIYLEYIRDDSLGNSDKGNSECSWVSLGLDCMYMPWGMYIIDLYLFDLSWINNIF